MRFSTIILLLSLAIDSLGQAHYLGIEGGVTRTNVKSNNFLDSNHDRTGWSGGLTYQLQFSKNYVLSGGLLYIQKGFNNDLTYTDEQGNPVETLGGTIAFRYNYLSIPIKGGLRLGKKLFGFVNIGIVPSILVHANVTEPAIDGHTDEKTRDVTERVSKFDLGGLGELGIGYELFNSLLISTSLEYYHGITSITNENYFPDNKIRHFGTVLSFALNYKLGNKP